MAAFLLDWRKVSKSVGARINHRCFKAEGVASIPAKILGVGGKLLLLHLRVPTALFLDERKTGPSTTRLFLKRTQNWEIDEDTWPFIFAVRPQLNRVWTEKIHKTDCIQSILI